MGVWTIRGIPKLAVERNLPVANSTFTAAQIARRVRGVLATHTRLVHRHLCACICMCYRCTHLRYLTMTHISTQDTNCTWSAENMGLYVNAGGRAYYDSVAQWYASQGVDFVKVRGWQIIDALQRSLGLSGSHAYSFFAAPCCAVRSRAD